MRSATKRFPLLHVAVATGLIAVALAAAISPANTSTAEPARGREGKTTRVKSGKKSGNTPRINSEKNLGVLDRGVFPDLDYLVQTDPLTGLTWKTACLALNKLGGGK